MKMITLFRLTMFLIAAGFILTGCEDKEPVKPKAEDSPGKSEEQSSALSNRVPLAAENIEETASQKPGKLIEEHMEPDIEAAGSSDFNKYYSFYENTFEPIAQKELQAHFKKNKGMNSGQIYDYLVYQLGSGQYRSYYERLANYEHGYEMPELPDGSDEIQAAKHKKTNLVILMDASGSMKAKVADGVKMDLAKEAIESFTAKLDEDMNVSLVAYGHKGTGKESDKSLSCSSIESVYPLEKYDSASFNEAMNSFQASGWTPLAAAMDKARDLLAAYPPDKHRNMIYIVSDGVETCGGDPVAAAKKLKESGIEAKLTIIGFDVDDEGQKQLKQAADAAGGSYATVHDKSEFEGVLVKKWKPSIMQVVSQQGVMLNKMVDQKNELYNIYDPLDNITKREEQRIIKAARYLKGEKLISEDDASRVEERAARMNNMRREHFKNLKEQKSTEAEQAMKDINDKVEDWKKKWYKELE